MQLNRFHDLLLSVVQKRDILPRRFLQIILPAILCPLFLYWTILFFGQSWITHFRNSVEWQVLAGFVVLAGLIGAKPIIPLILSTIWQRWNGWTARLSGPSAYITSIVALVVLAGPSVHIRYLISADCLIVLNKWTPLSWGDGGDEHAARDRDIQRHCPQHREVLLDFLSAIADRGVTYGAAPTREQQFRVHIGIGTPVAIRTISYFGLAIHSMKRNDAERTLAFLAQAEEWSLVPPRRIRAFFLRNAGILTAGFVREVDAEHKAEVARYAGHLLDDALDSVSPTSVGWFGLMNTRAALMRDTGQALRAAKEWRSLIDFLERRPPEDRRRYEGQAHLGHLWHNLASAEIMQGRLEEALGSLGEALEECPKADTGTRRLIVRKYAVICKKLGDIKTGRAIARELQLGPGVEGKVDPSDAVVCGYLGTGPERKQHYVLALTLSGFSWHKQGIPKSWWNGTFRDVDKRRLAALIKTASGGVEVTPDELFDTP